jgi:dTMP kinase
MKKGRFITFEGGEGCGKSTQIRRLESFLKEKGVKVLVTREPGGTRLAELIRGLLKDEKDDPPCDRAELLLFLAARAQLVKNVILPALESGVWVLSDRFSDSTFAYQGYGRGLDLEILKIANDFACDSLKPDLTLLLDVPAEVAASRMRKRERETNTSADRIELAGDEFHLRLREGFRALAAAEPERIITVDASGTPDEVWEAVCRSLKRLI